MTRSSSWWYGMIRCALPERRSWRVSTPFAASMSISSSSTAGSTTTPLPITGTTHGIQHAARNELQLEDLAVDDQRVAGVVAALIADAHRRFLGEVVGDAALALVAPLGADDHCAGHETLPGNNCTVRGHVGEMVLDGFTAPCWGEVAAATLSG